MSDNFTFRREEWEHNKNFVRVLVFANNENCGALSFTQEEWEVLQHVLTHGVSMYQDGEVCVSIEGNKSSQSAFVKGA
jgi:hypothetical protein